MHRPFCGSDFEHSSFRFESIAAVVDCHRDRPLWPRCWRITGSGERLV